jgi:hypothetical protein
MSPDTGNGADPDPARAGAAGGGGPASPRRDRIVSELAGEIRAARADVARLAVLVAENADLLAQVLPRVAGLDDAVAELGGRVDALAENAAETGVAPVNWPALTAEQAAAEWAALAEWVATVLGPFYEITRAELPDCWARHRPAVLELVWLRRAYLAAHAPDAAAIAAAEWHTRWRRDALANIATIIPKRWCRPGEHYVHEHDRPHGSQIGQPVERYHHTPGQRPDPADLRVGADGEITDPRYWEPGYRAAAEADLAWRRARDAAATAQ